MRQENQSPETLNNLVLRKTNIVTIYRGGSSTSERRAEIIAYEDLGPEAIRKLEVEDLPVIVVNDIRGNDLYIEGEKKYRRS